jgi:branched-chain amino acid transport system ATP-binding protein
MLKISDLYYQLDNTPILNGIHLKLQPGEQAGLIGPNGSGKTTLFNCICGFNQPQQGRIEINNIDVTNLAPHKRANLGLGRVFQHFGVFKDMTVLENMMIATENNTYLSLLPWSRKSKFRRNEAIQYLDSVGLASRAQCKAGSLSGGQLRLLEIARTLLSGAELLLLDEPTAGVSPKMQGQIEQMLKHLKNLGKTVLIIEHDMNFIQRICERVIVLDVGRVILDSDTATVKSSPLLHEIYFGTDCSDTCSDTRSATDPTESTTTSAFAVSEARQAAAVGR